MTAGAVVGTLMTGGVSLQAQTNSTGQLEQENQDLDQEYQDQDNTQ